MPGERKYAEAGVDIAARSVFARRLPGILARARRPEVLSDAGPFSGLFRLGDRYRDPVLSASADGIGTKVKLQLAAGRLDLCGPDILGHSINDILVCGAEPIFFLDYIAGNGLSNAQKEALVEGVANACAEAGCALLGGETADMPDVYPPGEFDLAGFIVGVVERDAIIDGSRIRPGDALIGLPSSGLHTNGFSLARRALDVANGEPPEETRRRLEERPPELGGATLGEALLATHRPYAKEVRPVIGMVRGMAHITGGGYRENVPRILPGGVTAVIDTRAWEVPGIFRLIAARGRVAAEEMYEVFNMGIGMVLMVGQEDAEAVLAAIPGAVRVGEVRAWTGRAVELLGLE
ncbi:phosphoribosylformylglycinamidine cyclo-ligase [Tepidiforma flava]|uniref:Phosphoribosylformylglycinamidine cyclo-ligase n=1 Tax=Tepidiforma flava TaxID=3004094 RepID=A0ABY7M9F9_9CHLR|nr:phosphoribosylformylglycinamidine cyclo-ligase [Tepidiforma flava]WBL36902.1 phosphoribosylformylglycinamidine cyclo-ligase [Tepidiforma flava]